MRSKRNPIYKSAIKVGLTIGDPSGVGPAVALKALANLGNFAEFIVIGDDKVLSKACSLKFKAHRQKFQVIGLNNINHKKFSFGKINAEYGRASMEYLDKGLELIRGKKIDCLVTCPISKEAINLAGFRYTGHTEYFAKRLNLNHSVMMLLNRFLKFSLVTRHIPFKDVARKIDKRSLIDTIEVTYGALKNFFALESPRIVVCGLNPHASDNGLIGREEKTVIAPVIKEMRKRYKGLLGPISADAAIKEALLKKHDCVIALYHDQALIPLKLLGDESGVNLTLGLPFIRTSPLHGTAFDIAARPHLANPASLIAAIKLAVKCAQNQKKG